MANGASWRGGRWRLSAVRKLQADLATGRGRQTSTFRTGGHSPTRTSLVLPGTPPVDIVVAVHRRESQEQAPAIGRDFGR